MTHEILDFYESLADYYHLIFEDWDRSIHWQAKVLDLLISRELPGRPLKILDCACGIGTQALGFASLGHHVVASDLSATAVRRAEKEAQIRSLNIKFYVSDMTSLREIPDTHFDVVAALDNALPHLTPGQLAQAIKAIASRLNSGGLFIASIRDYDLLVQQRPAMQEPLSSEAKEPEGSITRFGTGLKRQNTSSTCTSRSRPVSSGRRITSFRSTDA